ncbi:MAG TPA: alpha/beta fold hydrolase [Terriglobales bacterium]|nr:alpha/beta fold hydrolase [Terriglobales bacterium]
MPPVPAPGTMVRIGERVLHVQVQPAADGVTTPTVVLEAALGGSSLGWVYVQRALAGEAPLVSYDRAGMGYSPAGPQPRDLPRMIADLEAVLQATAAAPPYLLVGHSFGALIVRQFAALHPDQTAGVILVDPPWLEEWSHPDAASQAKLDSGIRLSRRGMWAARCGIAQFAAWLVATGALKWAARCATLVSGGKLRTAEDFNFTPATRLPPELKPAMRWFWSRARFYQALASQMESLPAAARTIATAPPLGNIPLVVLSAADTPAAQLAEHQRLAAAASHGEHRVARASGHWIPLEEPDLVVAAIRGLLAAVPSI